jgi:hypothetical protein
VPGDDVDVCEGAGVLGDCDDVDGAGVLGEGVDGACVEEFSCAMQKAKRAINAITARRSFFVFILFLVLFSCVCCAVSSRIWLFYRPAKCHDYYSKENNIIFILTKIREFDN